MIRTIRVGNALGNADLYAGIVPAKEFVLNDQVIGNLIIIEGVGNTVAPSYTQALAIQMEYPDGAG